MLSYYLKHHHLKNIYIYIIICVSACMYVCFNINMHIPLHTKIFDVDISPCILSTSILLSFKILSSSQCLHLYKYL